MRIMAEVNSFLCYRSYLEAADMLPEEKRWPFFRAVMVYALDSIDPCFTDYDTKLAFTLMKSNIDSCNKRYSASVENGKKGGRPLKKPQENKPRNNPEKPSHNLKPKPSNNLNKDKDDNVNDNPYPRVSEEGALPAPPPPPNGGIGERFMLDGKQFEYYTASNGERRVREIG